MENRKKAALIAAGAALCVIAGIILMFVFLNKGNEDQTLENESSEVSEVLELTVTETQEITEVTETTTREETATNTTAAKETTAAKAETAASSTTAQKHEPTPQQGGQAAPSPAQTQAPQVPQTQAPQVPQTQTSTQTKTPQAPQTQAPSGNLETIYCEDYNDVFRDFEQNPLLVDKQNKTIIFGDNFVKYANGFFDVRNVIDIDDNKLNLKTCTYVVEGMEDTMWSDFNGYTCIIKIPAEAFKWSNYKYWVQFSNNIVIARLEYRNFFVNYSQGMNYFSYASYDDDGSLDEL